MDALNHGEIVGTHHFPDAVTDHAAQNFSDLNHDLNSSYSSHVESISQGLDQHSHGFLNDLHPNTILHSDCVSFSSGDFHSNFDHLHNSSYIETPSFESHLSTSNFHAEVIPREATPDYAEASRNEGWAKHYEERAAGWASEGSFSQADYLQKEADYYHQKAAENLNQ
ncbi:MAG: hypothetical protein NTY89_08280 [Nostocales cyanobacterium LacPavin_0920_SED1_MAG_38_18]|jgi:hypothetical protein|uniref:hypothetical protein n=1 Tax=Anabaena sp. WA102 TaxID=1647413 RepID=UPI0006ABFDEA|nr:hypothetical protein [Anabaena sp. WA102]ALB42867.1 hypothetical protein AA650_22570 [Anabaena sp. WA102]MCX5981784.1 hypothetical protein [Nostocales cyanobacterium LacPavin_0920_SED1_MAG_38_18]